MSLLYEMDIRAAHSILLHNNNYYNIIGRHVGMPNSNAEE